MNFILWGVFGEQSFSPCGLGFIGNLIFLLQPAKYGGMWQRTGIAPPTPPALTTATLINTVYSTAPTTRYLFRPFTSHNAPADAKHANVIQPRVISDMSIEV